MRFLSGLEAVERLMRTESSHDAEITKIRVGALTRHWNDDVIHVPVSRVKKGVTCAKDR